MKTSLSALFLFVTILASSSGAFATCRVLSDKNIEDIQNNGRDARKHTTYNVSFGSTTIDVDPDLAIGEIIAEGKSESYNAFAFIWCTVPSGTINFDLTSSSTEIADHVFQTNVPGVGFRLTQVRVVGSLPESHLPYKNPWSDVKDNYISMPPGAIFRVQLIKTSNDIPSFSEVQLSGNIGRVSGDDGQAVISIMGRNVFLRVLPSCQVDSRTLNVDFGQFGPRDIKDGEGPTKPVQFKVLCSGPTPPESIVATLQATPDSDDPSLIQNTGAQHLGIRLRDRATRYILKPNDPNSGFPVKPDAPMEHSFDLEATVLRTGTQAPTAGKIDATSVITLTIL
ncbi:MULTISPECIES: fimbrial protein [Burkholderia]|uniref:fimbrial protein n=1 Tax=Burkholderia TaxID=32008 RepID=UPI0007592146|nr:MULTISPECIES: fimbrial protein [Burkholderia]AOJ72714.1 hypothetical protein WS78_28970 [Burkholderia savannae]KVG45054.1 hypothetical protein WS77_07780 [Burkholderia sp. MSMB0265]KVG90044.1 hypothetical protein WS81_20010 [Burkholderia sp. MSMB2040]KVG96183.1 hypothetical protein WS82_03190 [Burkholderia sp. MSMB2041]KVG99812.1 hypothetical protein WS83_25225 [Burkholderia sp. MSMB2042]